MSFSRLASIDRREISGAKTFVYCLSGGVFGIERRCCSECPAEFKLADRKHRKNVSRGEGSTAATRLDGTDRDKIGRRASRKSARTKSTWNASRARWIDKDCRGAQKVAGFGFAVCLPEIWVSSLAIVGAPPYGPSRTFTWAPSMFAFEGTANLAIADDAQFTSGLSIAYVAAARNDLRGAIDCPGCLSSEDLIAPGCLGASSPPAAVRCRSGVLRFGNDRSIR